MITKKNTYVYIFMTTLITGCLSHNIKNIAPESSDYKSYGERTPLDRRISASGTASNISSSIPPVLEEEFVEYEAVIEGSNTVINPNQANDDTVIMSEDPVDDWLAEEGVTLKDLLSEWAEKAGWKLVWKTNRNYTLTAGAMFRARFADAASALVRAFARARPAPVAIFYKGNRVLVIETLEDENAYE